MFAQINRHTRYFDWMSCSLTITLALLGVLFVWSTTHSPETPLSPFFKKQCLGIAFGIIGYCLAASLESHTLLRWGYLCYLALLPLLAYTLIKGSIGMGAQRWINLFIFKFQPSELAKLFFPAYVAHHIHATRARAQTIVDQLLLLAVLGATTLLVFKQPDLGTALMLASSGIVLLWCTGVPRKFFLIGLAIMSICTPLAWTYGLHAYQKKRVLTFLGYGDANKERYQVEQSIMTIGSGGIFGKGLQRGTQNTLRFLPESRTDFIFAIICEEWGLLGALFILLLYLALFFRSFALAHLSRQRHAQLLAIGLVLPTMIATITNIGMVLGLLPVVGIPLPLISYGMTNLITTMTSFGWLNGISMHSASHRAEQPSPMPQGN